VCLQERSNSFIFIINCFSLHIDNLSCLEIGEDVNLCLAGLVNWINFTIACDTLVGLYIEVFILFAGEAVCNIAIVLFTWTWVYNCIGTALDLLNQVLFVLRDLNLWSGQQPIEVV
jgi:hypothetical protein